jgi:hypothetical protein
VPFHHANFQLLECGHRSMSGAVSFAKRNKHSERRYRPCGVRKAPICIKLGSSYRSTSVGELLRTSHRIMSELEKESLVSAKLHRSAGGGK